MENRKCIKCNKTKPIDEFRERNKERGWHDTDCLVCQRIYHRNKKLADPIKTSLNKMYWHIKQRCNNPKLEEYKNYGGRGIKICKEWSDDFQLFYIWATTHGYKEDLQIDRIDNNGNYEPNNCRFVTAWENNLNRRNNKIITYKGITRPLAWFIKILQLPESMIRHRIYRGWNIQDTFEKPYGYRAPYKRLENSHR